MTLQDAIEKVLRDYNRPLSAKDILSLINSHNYYSRKDSEPLQGKHVLARIKNYPTIFQNVNGYIILVENEGWKKLLTSYWYLVNFLRGIYILADIQLIIATLLFYKRLVDINDKPGRRYPLNDESKSNSSIYESPAGDQILIEQLNLIEKYNLGPQGVFEESVRLLEKLDTFQKHEIWFILNQIDTKELDDFEFGNIFDYFLTLESLDNYKSFVNHTPYSLRELMVGLLDPTTGSSIYDPVAGTGGLLIDSFFHFKDSEIYVKGAEINRRVAQLGNMNLLMHGITNGRIEARDCFEEVNTDRSFDYIIADLPANGITNSVEHLMLYYNYGLDAQKTGKSFGSLVLLVLAKLEKQGKAVLSVSDGFLVKKGKEKQIRDLLIQEDIIESIISLPYGTLRPYTDAKASILVLNRRKPTYLTHRIKFITAKVSNQDSKSLVLNNDDIIKAYKSSEIISKDSQIVNITDLRADTNLSVEAYETEFALANAMLKEESAKQLSDLVDIRSGLQPEKVDISIYGDVALVRVENLSKDILDLNLTKELNSKVFINPKYSRSIIERECILIARIGESLKPTIFRPTEEVPSIIAHSNIYVLIPKGETSEINLEYLYYQLHTSLIQEQIEKRRLGAVMPYISISGLKQIIIPYTNMNTQISSVELQKANLIAEERRRVEERIMAMGYKEEVKQTESDIIKTLTHQLRPTFLGLNNVVNRIERIVDKENLGDFKEHNQVELDELIDPEIAEFTKKPDNYSLQELLKKIAEDSSHLSTILSNVDKVMNLKLLTEDFEQVDILDFLKKYKEQKDIEINHKYSIVIRGNSIVALIHKGAFKELLDQLLMNAENHGFRDKQNDNSLKVQFTVKYDKVRNVVSIEYLNNGNPYRLTQRDFITVFEKDKKSSGSGIGGNYIYKIIEAHHGKITVAENYEKGFLLIIELPLQQNQEDE